VSRSAIAGGIGHPGPLTQIADWTFPRRRACSSRLWTARSARCGRKLRSHGRPPIADPAPAWPVKRPGEGRQERWRIQRRKVFKRR